MLPPVRFAAASIVINAAPVGNAQTNVRIMRKKAAPFFRSLPMCATDVPSAAPALWKNTFIMRIRHIWNTWKSVPNQESGFNLTEEELQQLDSIISPLIKNGQSLHHILKNNPDTISCCLKTAYRYADNGLFQARNIDMPRKVRFRPRKKKSVPLKVDKACRNRRTFEDFKKYCKEYPSLPVVQIDSVEGVKGGAVLLTVHFVLPRLQLSFLRKANDSRSVIDIFNHLYEVLGEELYKKLFPILLADNGTEFSNPEALEKDDKGNLRSRVFYCDPSAPGQKGACENNHEFIRRVIPKGTDIGLYSESQIAKMMNHINSYGRPELGDKSPFEMFAFYYGSNALDLLGVKQISPNEIILKPELLKENQGS